MKSYIVIGLGLFGTAMALKLYELGEEVLVIDTDEDMVNRIADRVTRAVTADARDRDVLAKLGAGNFDRAIVAVGTDLAASALITMNLKSLHVPFIACKAYDDTHREILERLGADLVIIPEREVADKLALGMTHAGIMEYIELSDEFGIVELQTPGSWQGKTIRSLELRTRCGVNVIALRRGEKIIIPPPIDDPLTAEEALVILGDYKMLNKLKSDE